MEKLDRKKNPQVIIFKNMKIMEYLHNAKI